MPIKFIDYYTRETLQQNPGEYFVFGDNYQERGLGGQAKEARGEPNALGIRTKWKPTKDDDAYFSDDNAACLPMIKQDIQDIIEKLDEGRVVWFPKAGVGSHRAKLKEKAPKLHRYIYCEVVRLYHLYRDHNAIPELDL